MKKRRTMLFIPGNNPGMLVNGPVLGADSLIYDLEDAVAESEKDAARTLVKNALSTVNFQGVERVVRINGLDTPHWQADLREILSGGLDTVMLPKASKAEDVQTIAENLSSLENELGLPEGQTGIFVILESAQGIERAYEIASAHERMQGMLLGGEDLSADIGAKRTKSGEEIQYSRGRMVIAAKAAGIQAIDAPFTDVNDMEGLERDTSLACQMGFDGKALISPHHVFDVNRLFSPSQDEVEWAQRVMAAAERAKAEGKGAVSLDGKMIDAPIIKRAQNTLELAGLDHGRQA
jgi:citrate lyase subunit beta/citryl-CoA lyase